MPITKYFEISKKYKLLTLKFIYLMSIYFILLVSMSGNFESTVEHLESYTFVFLLVGAFSFCGVLSHVKS